MCKQDNHINEPFKLTVFRSFEEMKATPFSFPSNKPSAQREAEREKPLIVYCSFVTKKPMFFSCLMALGGLPVIIVIRQSKKIFVLEKVQVVLKK
jgi:hypothetical protein